MSVFKSKRNLMTPILILTLLLQAHSAYTAQDGCLRPMAAKERNDDKDARIEREADIYLLLASPTGVEELMVKFFSGVFGSEEWLAVIRILKEALRDENSNIIWRFEDAVGGFEYINKKIGEQLVAVGEEKRAEYIDRRYRALLPLVIKAHRRHIGVQVLPPALLPMSVEADKATLTQI